jgi:hypothetical protein
MKMIKLYFPALALAFALTIQTAPAQTSSSQLPASASGQAASNSLTLSGIDLFPNQKQGTFQLRFTQQLKFETDTNETATLLLTDAAGNVIYSDIFNPMVNVPGRPVDVGKLANGIYLIEVKTNETTFWKKVKVNNPVETTKTKTKTKRRS